MGGVNSCINHDVIRGFYVGHNTDLNRRDLFIHYIGDSKDNRLWSIGRINMNYWEKVGREWERKVNRLYIKENEP